MLNQRHACATGIPTVPDSPRGSVSSRVVIDTEFRQTPGTVHSFGDNSEIFLMNCTWCSFAESRELGNVRTEHQLLDSNVI